MSFFNWDFPLEGRFLPKYAYRYGPLHYYVFFPHSRIQIWDLMAQRNPALFYEKEEDLLLELQEWVIALRLLDLQIAIKIIFNFFEKKRPWFCQTCKSNVKSSNLKSVFSAQDCFSITDTLF